MKLKDITDPRMLQSAAMEDMEELAREVRDEIIRTVSRNGGHLASNLGAVELTLALYAVFDFAQDRLVWDVGHQCYTHKLLTGRYKAFATLRQTDGVCGFPRCEESPYDLFNTGHSSSALSAALGLARARELKNEKHHVVAQLRVAPFSNITDKYGFDFSILCMNEETARYMDSYIPSDCFVI